MKFFLTAIMAAFSTIALAAVDNPCNVTGTPQVVYPYIDFANGGAITCAPIQSANSTWPTTRINAAGAMAYWYCKSPSGVWSAQWVAGTTAFLLGNNVAGEAAAAAGAASAPAQALEAVRRKYVNLPLADASLTPVWCPYVNEMVANTPPTVPTVPTKPSYVVAPNGTSLTRPAFAFANGARSYSTSKSVPVGSACDCTTKLTEGANTFCSVAPQLVAMCVKAP